MMKYFRFQRIALALAALVVLNSCDPNEQKVEPVMDANTKAQYTVTRVDEGAGSSTVAEGSILEFEITTDKMVDAAIDFTAEFEAAAAASGLDEHDYEIVGGTLAPYAQSATMTVEILEDGFPEPAEALDFNVGAFDIAQNWRLNPNSTAQNFNFSVENVNQDGVVTIALSWPDDHDDLDMYIYSVGAAGDWGGFASATGSLPEVNTNLWPNDPDGTYYVGIDPYVLTHGETDYTFNIGLPDGTVEVFSGHFNLEEAIAGEMPKDNGAYRLVEIVIAGGNVSTITHVNE